MNFSVIFQFIHVLKYYTEMGSFSACARVDNELETFSGLFFNVW